MIVSATVKPPPHPFYGDSYERGLDPWHIDAAPLEAGAAPFWDKGPRKSGWFLIDGFGNAIGFTVDGTEFTTPALTPPAEAAKGRGEEAV